MSDGGVYLWSVPTLQRMRYKAWRRALEGIAEDATRARARGSWCAWDSEDNLGLDAGEIAEQVRRLRALAREGQDARRLADIVPRLEYYPALKVLCVGYGTNLHGAASWWPATLYEWLTPDVVHETWT